MNLYKNYYYGIYRNYKVRLKQDEFSAKYGAMIMMCVIHNVHTLPFSFIIDLFFNKKLLKILNENDYIIIITVLFNIILLIIFYFFLVKEDKHNEIKEYFKNESTKQIKIREMLITLYVILTFVLLFITAYIYIEVFNFL